MTPPTTGTATARPEIVTREVASERPAWIERVTSADHKRVGELYIGTAFAFLALAAVEFLLMRVQLIVPQNTLIEPEIFNRLLTASASSFVVLFAIPLAVGLATYLVPLQIGARSTALPRLAQVSFWLYAMGALTLYGSFLYQAPEVGTAGLPPLAADTSFTPTNGADAWIAGTALALAGFTCAAVNILATISTTRAPGLALRRMPLFSWASLASSWILLVVGPAMVAALAMLMIDRRFDGIFFDAAEGGAPLFYEHVSYLFLTGAYLVVFLFAAGVISEILPTFSRKPIFSHRAVAGSFVAIAGLGLLAWMQNMYSAPINKGWMIAAMVLALSLAIPIGLLIYTWLATLWGGALKLRAASWYALLAVSTTAIGLAGELGYSVIPVGWALDNTTASQGDTLYVLVGGAVIGGFAALHYWFPKLSGRVLGEGLGKLALLLIVVGLHLYVIPMFFAGLEGQPVDIWQYHEGDGLDAYNLIASIGAIVLVLGVLVELANAAYSWGNGIAAGGHDPWGGSTLEWFALSPPPPHNFDAVPDVRSAEPLRDIRDAIALRLREYAPPARTRSGGTPANGGPSSGGTEGAADTAAPGAAVAPGAAEGAPAEHAGGDGDDTSRFEEAETEAQPETPPGEEPQTPEADPGTDEPAGPSEGSGADEPGSPR